MDRPAGGKAVRGAVGVVTLEGEYACCYAVGPRKARNDNRMFDPANETLAWHTLTPLKGAKPQSALGIAVPASDPVAATAIPGGTQFTWRSRTYRLTQCASSEGLHLLLDGGGRRVRHDYDYLSYDTDPDCDDRGLNQPVQAP